MESTATTDLWFRDAIIYQLHVRSFSDSTADGIGDFRGLTSRLDYIQELGVTAIWLMPFYPSPLRDEGYDIADYEAVNPIYGTLEDFEEFLRAAHARGLKVITELVINHTSDQHRWFQRARRAERGSPERDFYVWSDDPHRYGETRVIFQDFETSNWTWDAVAGQYFWHRFYSHQPDLNFDSPDVREAIFRIADFWLSRGVDGLRLDAIPYLYERDGTNCENLPETHEFLKALRAHVDRNHPGRMLLAEANQWPEDAAAYFGNGDECHMNFHFPLMPRLFMAVHHEDRFPIIDIVRQTPTIPDNCQWGIFLRNHDELTLEMVTDEERDSMYKAYASDEQARVNLGIRRRLAPLLKHNRRKIELMNALLLSLPGTPILYYGDELEMGDNIYLKDRDSVRSPMQWSPDRNAGFSRANPQRLFLPPIVDPEFHYETHNVETQSNNPHSLLWWMRTIIRLRCRHPAFARGAIEFLSPENAKVLVYLRTLEDDSILVVANLSRFSQFVELDLSRFRGRVPRELFGKQVFPMIGELPYFITMGPHTFYWFRLEWPEGHEVRYQPEHLPMVSCERDWREILVPGAAQANFTASLPDFLQKHRWFAGKARPIQNVSLEDSISIKADGPKGREFELLLCSVTFVEGEPETYLLPVIFATGKLLDDITNDRPSASICQLSTREHAREGVLCDATAEPELWTELVELIGRGRTLGGRLGKLHGSPTAVFTQLGGYQESLDPAIHTRQQSNSSASIGQRFILKLFRRLAEGENPDVEIGRHFLESATSVPVPRLAGSLQYTLAGRPPTTIAFLQEFAANDGDAWTWALGELGRYLEQIDSSKVEAEPKARGGVAAFLDRAGSDYSSLAKTTMGSFLDSIELLGRRTAEVHVALADSREDKAFEPIAFTKLYQRSLYQSMRSTTVRSFQTLRRRLGFLPKDLQADAERVLLLEESLLERFQRLIPASLNSRRIRVHGDYHLGQVLFTGKDFLLIDFEGEPDRPISERRLKRSPLRDVAGMLRSFHYASYADLLGLIPGQSNGNPKASARHRYWLSRWYEWTSIAFLKGYGSVARPHGLMPDDVEESRLLLEVYVLEKLVYELRYELNSRPDWAVIPLQGLLELLDEEDGDSTIVV